MPILCHLPMESSVMDDPVSKSVKNAKMTKTPFFGIWPKTPFWPFFDQKSVPFIEYSLSRVRGRLLRKWAKRGSEKGSKMTQKWVQEGPSKNPVSENGTFWGWACIYCGVSDPLTRFLLLFGSSKWKFPCSKISKIDCRILLRISRKSGKSENRQKTVKKMD